MQENRKIAVVILVWNGAKFLQQFLPSVIKYSPGCQIVVADNCSTDNSAEFVKEHFPEVKVVKNATNTGFAGGYNQALKSVEAEYYVLLNQDVEVTEGWVEVVISAMEADKKVVAAQPKIKSFYQKDHFEYAGACGGYIDKFGYAFCRGRIFDTIEKDEGQYDTPADIFWASGACLFVRSEVFWGAGGFDEDFFAHQEEIDLCWRIKNLGYKIICVPSAVVYHVGGGSLPQGNPRKTYLNFRNNMMMLFKNLPVTALLWKIPFRMVLDVAAMLYSLFKNRNFKDVKAILKAEVSFVAAIPRLRLKRKQLPHPSSVHLSDISVTWRYFVLGKRKYSELK